MNCVYILQYLASLQTVVSSFKLINVCHPNSLVIWVTSYVTVFPLISDFYYNFFVIFILYITK